MKPDEKAKLEADDVRLSPYISSKLFRHIRACAEANEELALVIFRDKNCSDDDLVGWANARSCAYMYLMNCMNAVRADTNDFAPVGKADWFRPFVKSMLIAAEDGYRGKIGLPSILPEQPMDLALRHSSIASCVLNGARNPLSRWESGHELKHTDVS